MAALLIYCSHYVLIPIIFNLATSREGMVEHSHAKQTCDLEDRRQALYLL